jgi:hypothetical protein
MATSQRQDDQKEPVYWPTSGIAAIPHPWNTSYAMPPMEQSSAERVKELADELATLSKQQSEALQTSAYILMSSEDAEHYDKRRIRIAEICGLIGKFRANSR